MAVRPGSSGLWSAPPVGETSPDDADLDALERTVGALSETVSNFLSGSLVVRHDQGVNLRTFLTDAISEVLTERGVPHADIGWPRFDVLAPAVEALRYTQSRVAFARLIAASMDTRSRDSILPAFVEILKQVGEDELAILRAMPPQGRLTPMADVLYIFPNQQVLSGYRSILLPDFAAVCAVASNIPVYVDNLLRLNLISRPVGQTAADEAYTVLARQDFVVHLLDAGPPRSQGRLERAVVGVTDLGEAFRAACL